MNTDKIRAIVLAALMVGSVLAGTIAFAGAASAATSTTVSLDPASASIDSGSTQTYSIVVGSVSGGVGAYNVSVSVNDTTTAEITNISDATGAADSFVNTHVANDGSEATISVGVTNTTDTASNLTIATVTVEGASEGVVALNPTVRALGDRAAKSYTVTSTRNALLVVNQPLSGSTTGGTTQRSITTSGDESTTTQSPGTSTTHRRDGSGGSTPGFTGSVALVAAFTAILLSTRSHNN